MNIKLWQKTSLVALGLCYVICAILIFIDNQRQLKEEFHGKITEINFGSKDFVFVKINDTLHSLGSIGRKIKGKVKINDRVNKYTNNPHYYIILRTGEVLKF